MASVRFVNMSPPQVQNYVVDFVAETLGTPRSQLKVIRIKPTPRGLFIIGTYRHPKCNRLYEYEIDITRGGQLVKDQVKL